MISEARVRGIVTIKVQESIDSETALERKIRTRFNLYRAFAIPSKISDSIQNKVAVFAAHYLREVITSGDIVGVGGGNTILQCADNMENREDLENITVVQLDGNMINLGHVTHTQAIPRRIADAVNGTPIFYPVPMMIRDEKTRELLMRDENIATVISLQKKANIALFTVSGTGMGRSTSTVQSNFLKSTQLEDMVLHGVVGSLGGHFIRSDGSLYDTELDRQVLSLSLEDLKKKDHKICIGAGRSKYEGLFAALCGGYVNTLIVDTDAAQAIAMMSN